LLQSATGDSRRGSGLGGPFLAGVRAYDSTQSRVFATGWSSRNEGGADGDKPPTASPAELTVDRPAPAARFSWISCYLAAGCHWGALRFFLWRLSMPELRPPPPAHAVRVRALAHERADRVGQQPWDPGV